MYKPILKIFLSIYCLTILAQLHAQTNKCGLILPKSTVSPNANFQSRVQALRTADADSVYTLPVVVHVIHTGGSIGSADNPSDVLINAMIDNLTKAWGKNGASYGGADMKIQFQLATKSPSCGTTTGINRINGGGITNYSSGGITNTANPSSADEITIKNLSRWPNTDYINIWIVNKINGSSTSPGGYAYFPELNEASIDGIVLQASVVDGTNKTIVHEMGHVFYLYHTFYDDAYETTCASNSDCNADGDRVCDTEPSLAETSCSVTTNSCSGNPFAIADADKGYTVLNNYMGYTNCQWMFTAGQKTRARAALFAFRHGLISSGGLGTPTSSPTAACIPTATYGLSPYYGVQQVDFNTLTVYSNTSEADGSRYIDRTCNQSTTVTKGQAYTLSITGSYGNPHRIKAYIDYNNDGDFDDAGETLLSAGFDQTIAMVTVTIPLTGVVTNTPLRLRIVADKPGSSEPTACQLNGSSADGAGQIEDYSVVVLPRQITSITSGNWSNSSTWSCSCIPENDDQVTIISPHTVAVTSATTVYDLTLNTGAGLTISGTNILQVGNTLTNNGTISSTGTLEMNGTTVQTINGTGRIANLTLNNSNGATIASGLQTITSVLTLSSGLLTTNGHVTLESTPSNTARVAPITSGSITGNLTVERYISSSSNRAYRLLASSVNSGGGSKPYIRDNWQEGTNNPDASSNNNPLAGYGTHITGSNTSLGFDVTATGQPSLYTYNQASPAWVAAANTNATTLDGKTGYLIFIRGDRTATNISNSAGSSNTTLRATGTLLTGNQTYALQPNQNDFTLVTNPYASPINWATIFADSSNTHLVSAYTYWDPNISTRGGYVQVTTSGIKSPNTGNATVEIQAGQAFFIQAATASPTLVIKESHKSTTSNIDVFRTGGPEQFSTSLYFKMPDGTRRIADGVTSIFDNTYSAAPGSEDIQEISNFDENVAIARDGKMLGIEGRPLIDANDNIPLSVARLKQQPYEWQFDPSGFSSPNIQAYLQDKFLNSKTPVSIINTTVIPINITDDPASAAADRFTIVFAPAAILPVCKTIVKAYQKSTGIQVEWNVLNEINIDKYEIEKSQNGITFTSLTTVAATVNSSTSKTYNWYDANASTGNNFYRIRSFSKTGTIAYSEVIRMNIGKGAMMITVYPNPVNGDLIGLQFSNLEKGKYTMHLVNQSGQEVYRKVIEHAGGSASETLQLQSVLAKGVYQLQVKGTYVDVTKQVIKQ